VGGGSGLTGEDGHREDSMSFYLDMLKKSSQGTKAFLLLVNEHGEAVVHRLDATGNSAGFAAGGALEVLGLPLKSAVPDLHLVRIKDPDSPSSWGLYQESNRWRAVLGVLNLPKSSIRRARHIENLGNMRSLKLPLEDYVRWVWGSRLEQTKDRYILTEKAIEADRKADEAEAARESKP
jgi:hypothetical protein